MYFEMYSQIIRIFEKTDFYRQNFDNSYQKNENSVFTTATFGYRV